MFSASSFKPDNATVTHQMPRQKITAFARLRSFGGSFIHPGRKSSPVVFPPPSWDLSDDLLGVNPSSPSLLESNFADPPAVEPISFAQRLRGLIEALPLQLPGTSNSYAQTSSVRPETETQSDEGKQGSPVPPGMDDDLVRLLSSEDVMNGKRASTSNKDDKGAGRVGIWNILASLRNIGGINDQNRPGVVEEAEDGVMMYAPLEPKSDSQLELASSETLLEYVDEPGSRKSGTRRSSENQAGGSTSKAKAKDTVIEKHVWVPSTTQLSLLATWWGYRLYLPPPVMAKLSGTSLKATARAAMITTALKWLLDKIPIMLVPVQFRPAVKMLKLLSPVVGYIGVFIAWSWDRVRALDNGNGVVLTATWLLPVALVPMTWDAGDIYGPRPPPGPEEISAAQQAEKPSNKDKADDKEKPKEERKKHFFHW